MAAPTEQTISAHRSSQNVDRSPSYGPVRGLPIIAPAPLKILAGGAFALVQVLVNVFAPMPSGPAAWGAAEAVGSGRTRPVRDHRSRERARGASRPDRRQRLFGHDHHAATAVSWQHFYFEVFVVGVATIGADVLGLAVASDSSNIFTS